MSETVKLWLGDEAVAHGAMDAGISGVYGYPGTPSTEILECVQRHPRAVERNIHRQWSANEKTAYEEALGMSYAGCRALVTMKHVGLNVAADAFINSAVTGVNGGLVVAVADDPSMHSSQNEQDSRFYARFAMVPLLEPSNQQEAYDMTRRAFDCSEEFGLPVVVRLVTRLAHSRSGVHAVPPREENPLRLPEDRRQFVLLPANARRNYEQLLAKQPRVQALSETSPYNAFEDGSDGTMGVVVCGLAYNYLRECFPHGCPYPTVAIRQYPAPAELLRRLAGRVRRWLVIEEGAPFLEEQLRGMLPSGVEITGRMDGRLPRTGELSPDTVAAAFGLTLGSGAAVAQVVAARPPVLCAGCPHADSYRFITEVMKDHPHGRVFSDIGCYTLGALPPFDAIDSCVDMGAAITMAKGAADAGVRPALAVIGDSTFTHSGMTGLLDAVYEGTPITVVILDNGTTGMTGGQVSMGSGRFKEILRGLGVAEEHIRVVKPVRHEHERNVAILREEIAHKGVSVLVALRPCIHVTGKEA